MENSTISLILICIVLSGLVFYFYTNSEKENLEYTNVSISAEYNNQKISTGYVIETSQGNILGNTSQSYELVRVPTQQIKIYNVNIEDQTFYRDSKLINLSKDNQRIDLRLEQPSDIKISQSNEEDLIILDLYSTDVRNVNFCLTWSFAFYKISVLNYTEIPKPEEYKNWDKCYSEFTLKDSNTQLNITYKEFITPKETDEIKIVFIQNEFLGKLDKEVKIR